MRFARTVAVAALVLVAMAVPSVAQAQAQAQSGTIEEIILVGNIRMTDRALVEALGVRVGDPYDAGVLVSAFQRLWAMGLFNDLTFEAEDGPGGGKVLIVKLSERPTLASVTYQDNKVLNRTQIEDRLIELEQGLEIGQPLDMKSVFIVESIIRDMLGEKGYLEAKVAAEPTEVTKDTSYSIHFFIQPGGKTRIRKIEFTGNEVFKDKSLRGTLTLTQGRKWYWPWSKKNLYHPVKWDQDSGAVRELYQNAGYLDVKVRPPIIEPIPDKKKKKKKKAAEAEVAAPEEVEVISPKKINKVIKAQQELDAAEQELEIVLAMEPPDGLAPQDEDKWHEKHEKKEEKARKKVNKAKGSLEKAETAAQPDTKKSWVTLTVPIDEGPQYSMGEITVEGNTVYEDEQLIALIPLRKGLVLSAALLKIGIDRITRVYGDRGYLYANVVRQIERHEGEPVADVAISIEEDQAYFVDTIEFKGNTSTKDKVLRREFRLLEGDLFSQTKLDLSMRKVNQLGYVAVPEDPIIEPIEGENKVRINIVVAEQGRNEIQVGGGYSGTDGAFFTGFYSTRNFLGRGQIMTVSLQIGGRTNRYGVSFIEPWFLGRPINLGFSLFSRDQDFGSGLQSSGRGGGIILGKQLGNFTQIQLNYNFESVQQTGFNIQESLATNRISSLTPSFTFNKINNPYRPTRGSSTQAQMQIAGGILGGDSSYYRPVVIYTGYRPGLVRKTYFGMHAQIGMVRAYGEGTTSNTSTVNEIPRFQRFWLGGETTGPRVFETRSITPRRFVRIDQTGQIVEAVKDATGRRIEDFDRNNDGLLNEFDLVELGGDRMYLLQSEWVYPLNEQLDIALFLDIGNSLFEDTRLSLDGVRVSGGVEVRFHLPVFPVPLRLLYGVPIREVELDRTSNFTFSLGRSF